MRRSGWPQKTCEDVACASAGAGQGGRAAEAGGDQAGGRGEAAAAVQQQARGGADLARVRALPRPRPPQVAAYLDIYNIYNIYNDICSSYDPHWALYTDHCAPCLADFTHIVRLDEDSELAALLATTGLATLLEDGGSLVTNPTSGGSSASVVRTYMEMLECEEVELIYLHV